MDCPKCGLSNAKLARRCQCGYELLTEDEWQRVYEEDAREFTADMSNARKHGGMIGLDNSHRFLSAYSKSPILGGLVAGCFLSMFISGFAALGSFLSGEVLYGVLYLIAIPILYVIGVSLHNSIMALST